jgi:RNA polymerase sigma-70 factor (ECF subfamily)
MSPTPLSPDADGVFAACFQQYYPLVYKTSFLLLDTAQDAEDAVQEIFLQVYRRWHTYDPERAARSTWIYRITVNHCTSRRRRAAWRYGILKHWKTSPPVTLTPSPEASLDHIAVQLALKQLSDKLRTVLVLRFYNDLTYEQVAEILEIPVGTAKSRVHSALKALRDHVPLPLRESLGAPSQELLQ